ncbi:MAG: RNase adapter RapZ [Desulfuromonadales bacterium]
MNAMRLVILTGLSGSGKSTAARALEDEGFFVVDNLPIALLPRLLEMTGQGTRENAQVAIVLDIRNRAFLVGWDAILQTVRELGHEIEIYFFDASDEDLIRRYSETRRRHPLVQAEGVPSAIARERELLTGLRRAATAIFDSSGLTVHQLRRKVIAYAHGVEVQPPSMVVRLQSFGYRHGIPADSDLLFDVRFLPNPHFIPELKPLTGLDRAVYGYVLAQSACADFLRHCRDLLQFLLPHYQREGKSYLTIGIGCTGGRHRSVAIVEALRPGLVAEGTTLEVIHRDIAKG